MEWEITTLLDNLPQWLSVIVLAVMVWRTRNSQTDILSNALQGALASLDTMRRRLDQVEEDRAAERAKAREERESMQAEIDDLIDQIDGVTNKLNEQRKELTALQMENTTLKARVAALERERDSLKIERDSLRRERDTLRRETGELRDRIAELEREVDSLKREQAERAALTKTEITSAGPGESLANTQNERGTDEHRE